MIKEPVHVNEEVRATPVPVVQFQEAVAAGQEPTLPPHEGPTVPRRPADGAKKAQWVRYAKALGLDVDTYGRQWTKERIIAWCDGDA